MITRSVAEFLGKIYGSAKDTAVGGGTDGVLLNVMNAISVATCRPV